MAILGKTVDTFAKSLDDYPSTYNFHESRDYVDYTDDIYVGYRYFETIPGAAEKVVYPFGYGLSYTTFDVETVSSGVVNSNCTSEANKLYAKVRVTNTGKFLQKRLFRYTLLNHKESLASLQRSSQPLKRQENCSRVNHSL